MNQLPMEATIIDPALREFGAANNYQHLVYGRIHKEQSNALLVAQLISEHPAGEGAVGRFYATKLNGLLLDSVFRFWASHGLGEVLWHAERREWVQVQGSGA